MAMGCFQKAAATTTRTPFLERLASNRIFKRCSSFINYPSRGESATTRNHVRGYAGAFSDSHP
ncbi:hypothetical protein ACP70R_013751 [Stipagrostis hirtigluma subsp. patula]